MMTFGERLALARKHIKLNQHKFGKKIGMSQATISLIEKDQQLANVELLIALEKIYNINPRYLMYGNGNILKSSKAIEDELQDSPSSLQQEVLKQMLGVHEMESKMKDLQEEIRQIKESLDDD